MGWDWVGQVGSSAPPASALDSTSKWHQVCRWHQGMWCSWFPVGRAATQGKYRRACVNFMKFNEAKWKVQHLDRGNLQYRLPKIESSSAEKGLGISEINSFRKYYTGIEEISDFLTYIGSNTNIQTLWQVLVLHYESPRHFGRSKNMTCYRARVSNSYLILMTFKGSFQDQYLQGIQVHDEKIVSTKCSSVLMASAMDPTLPQQN